MEQYIKVIALSLFFLFLVLQYWFGRKSKVIAYFFFVIAAVLYVRGYELDLWLQFVLIALILAIVLSSLHYEQKSKEADEETVRQEKQRTYAQRRKKK